MKQNNILFELDNISFSYKLGTVTIPALKKVSLSIQKGSLTTFTGPSGSGKSTLLNILGLIELLQEGEVFFEKRQLSSLTESEKNTIRKFDIGFIFQHFHLFPMLTAEENVSHFLKRQNLNKAEVQRRVEENLQLVGLWSHRKKKPKELSGGQMQRVAIARAMAKNPKVIIGDEITASLDQNNGREIMTIFQGLTQEKGVSVILTTHDPMVKSYSNNNFHIQDGLLA